MTKSKSGSVGMNQEKSKASSKAKPSRYPHVVTAISDTDDGWFYENPGSIEVIARKGGVTTQVRIPWSKVMKAAVRCGWKVRRHV